MKSIKKLLCCSRPAKLKGVREIRKNQYAYQAPGSSLYMSKEDGVTASPYIDLESCSSLEMEDAGDEARVEQDAVSISTRARYTYVLDK